MTWIRPELPSDGGGRTRAAANPAAPAGERARSFTDHGTGTALRARVARRSEEATGWRDGDAGCRCEQGGCWSPARGDRDDELTTAAESGAPVYVLIAPSPTQLCSD